MPALIAIALIVIAALIVVSAVVHLLFSPWLLIPAGIKFRPHSTSH